MSFHFLVVPSYEHHLQFCQCVLDLNIVSATIFSISSLFHNSSMLRAGSEEREGIGELERVEGGGGKRRERGLGQVEGKRRRRRVREFIYTATGHFLKLQTK